MIDLFFNYTDLLSEFLMISLCETYSKLLILIVDKVSDGIIQHELCNSEPTNGSKPTDVIMIKPTNGSKRKSYLLLKGFLTFIPTAQCDYIQG